MLMPPHEYVALSRVRPTPPMLSRCVVISAEQPSSEFFEWNVELGRDAGAVLDINRRAVRAYGENGIAAEHLQLGYSEAWDRRGRRRRARHRRALRRPLDAATRTGPGPLRGRARTVQLPFRALRRQRPQQRRRASTSRSARASSGCSAAQGPAQHPRRGRALLRVAADGGGDVLRLRRGHRALHRPRAAAGRASICVAGPLRGAGPAGRLARRRRGRARQDRRRRRTRACESRQRSRSGAATLLAAAERVDRPPGRPPGRRATSMVANTRIAIGPPARPRRRSRRRAGRRRSAAPCGR